VGHVTLKKRVGGGGIRGDYVSASDTHDDGEGGLSNTGENSQKTFCPLLSEGNARAILGHIMGGEGGENTAGQEMLPEWGALRKPLNVATGKKKKKATLPGDGEMGGRGRSAAPSSGLKGEQLVASRYRNKRFRERDGRGGEHGGMSNFQKGCQVGWGAKGPWGN